MYEQVIKLLIVGLLNDAESALLVQKNISL